MIITCTLHHLYHHKTSTMASFLRQLPRQGRLISLISASKQTPISSHSTALVGFFDQKSNAAAPVKSLAQSFHTTPIRFDNDSTTSSSSPNSSASIPPPEKIYQYSENVKDLSNEELNDPSTIPGFFSLIHSPPKDRVSTPRNALVGRVVSDKMQKTVNVEVDRYRIIPKYRKRWKYSKKFMAHDEDEVCKMGDLVMIAPCQRISRKKHFRVHEIIRKKGGASA